MVGKNEVYTLLKGKVLFEIRVSSDYTINDIKLTDNLDNFIQRCKKNFYTWRNLEEKYPNSTINYSHYWQIILENINQFWKNIGDIENITFEDIDDLINRYINNNYKVEDQKIYCFNVFCPLANSEFFDKIMKFSHYYLLKYNDNFDDAIRKLVYLYKNESYLGNYFDSTSYYIHYPAKFILEDNIENKIITTIEETGLENIQEKLLFPLKDELKHIGEQATILKLDTGVHIEYSKENLQKSITTLENKLNSLIERIDQWEIEKNENLNALEKTYKEKLKMEAPENLWKEKATEKNKQARNWTMITVVLSLLLIFSLSHLIYILYIAPIQSEQEFKMISKSFFLIAIITFFVYIIRVCIKIMLSAKHMETEYEQKAALTRFYQALIYDKQDITENEKLLIFNTLFNKTETGLIKSSESSEIDTLMSILLKKP